MDRITVPNSVFIDGQCYAATWRAEIVDDTTGELFITATIEDPARVVALSMNMDLARRLRAMAMQQAPEPECYDCRTTGERLTEIENMIHSLHEAQVLDARRGKSDQNQIREHSLVLVSLDQGYEGLAERLAALEARAEETDDTLSILRGRIDNDADALVQRLAALEAAAAPASHRHDGGHWITCPRCEDVGTVYLDGEDTACPACDGQGRIWEMPTEDRGSTMPLQVMTKSVLGLNRRPEAGL